MRDHNIILDSRGWPHLIDFRGTLAIDWASGVEDHGIIQKQHVVEMLEMYLKIFGMKRTLTTEGDI